MANCARCGRKTGGFSFRTLNATGRCDECDKDVHDNFERFRGHFQEFAAKGSLTRDEWTALERRGREVGIDITDALTYISNDVRAVITTLVDDLRKATDSPHDEATDFNYIKECLSIPEYYEEVDRPAEVKVKYTDLQGQAHEIAANGLLATCLQHEIDHLNGVLFIDHISKLKRDRVVKKFTKALKQAGKRAAE